MFRTVSKVLSDSSFLMLSRACHTHLRFWNCSLCSSLFALDLFLKPPVCVDRCLGSIADLLPKVDTQRAPRPICLVLAENQAPLWRG